MRGEASGERSQGLPAGAGLVAVLAVTAVLVGVGVLVARLALPVLPGPGVDSLDPGSAARDLAGSAATVPTPQGALASANAVVAPNVTVGAEVPSDAPIHRDPQARPQPQPTTTPPAAEASGGQPVVQSLESAQSGQLAADAHRPALPAAAGLPDDDAIEALSAVPLPVDLPSSAVLSGIEVPIGPAGVRSDGAEAFAHALLVRAQQRRPGLGDDASLRDVARRVLADQLSVSQRRGAPVPARVRVGDVTVQVEVVATLPNTRSADVQSIGRDVGAVGIAAGVAHRIEPNYLPDLVAVAAVAYR